MEVLKKKVSVILQTTSGTLKPLAIIIMAFTIFVHAPAGAEILGVEEEAALEGEPPQQEEKLTPSPDHPGMFLNAEGDLVDDLGIIQRFVKNDSLCIQCHYGKPEHEKLVLKWDKSKHRKRGITCTKCHGGNSAAQVLADAKKEGTGFKHIKEPMATLTGDKAKEVAFEYCGQCHGEKYREWEAGIHGKRLGSWNGEKQMWVCVKCHNPHNTKFRKIKPKPVPVKPSDLRNQAAKAAKDK